MGWDAQGTDGRQLSVGAARRAGTEDDAPGQREMKGCLACTRAYFEHAAGQAGNLLSSDLSPLSPMPTYPLHDLPSQLRTDKLFSLAMLVLFSNSLPGRPPSPQHWHVSVVINYKLLVLSKPIITL